MLKPTGLAKDGDFITAPEISQLFGEVLAAFQAWLWELSGSPDANEMMIFEAGPGRGTLFEDMHRSWRQICPQMAAAPVTFLETSPYLRSVLTSRFSGLDIHLAKTADNLPEVPLFGVANEFFDALAIRQAIKRDQGWVWRAIGLDIDQFVFCDGPALHPLMRCGSINWLLTRRQTAWLSSVRHQKLFWRGWPGM